MSTLKLKGGTTIIVNGHPACLGGDTDVDCASEDVEALREHSTTPYVEYPKAVTIDGVPQTAQSAEHEAQLRAALVLAPEPERPDPLEDVVVEMDNPAYNEPPKKHRKK